MKCFYGYKIIYTDSSPPVASSENPVSGPQLSGKAAFLVVIIVHSPFKEKVVPISFAVTVLVIESHDHAFAQI